MLIYNIKYWKLGEELGSGNLSNGVFKAHYTKDPRHQCAIKKIGRRDFIIGRREVEVIDRLLKLELCQEIIKFYGYEYTNEYIYIYMEYRDGFETVSNIINSRIEKRLNEDEIRNIAIGLLNALEFLSNNNIVHRDIKCENILYNKSLNQIKLIDFGISKFIVNNTFTYVGTNTHIAPETRVSNTTVKSDIWGLGCALIEMAGGLDLLQKTNDASHIFVESSKLDSLSNSFKFLIQCCLIKDQFDRPRAIDLRSQEFFINSLPNQKTNISNTHLILSNKMDLINISVPLLPTITNLILTEFNEPLESIRELIPNTISNLSLPVFNQPITNDNSIPSHIKSLSIPSFNYKLKQKSIPTTLRELVLGESFDFVNNGANIPSSIRSFSCSHNFTSPLNPHNNFIPTDAAVLVLNNYNQIISDPLNNGCGEIKYLIPSKVHTLTLGSNYSHFESLKNLPPSIFNLTLGVSKECKLKDDQIKEFIPRNILRPIIKRPGLIQYHIPSEWSIDYSNPLSQYSLFGGVYVGVKLNGRINGQLVTGKCAIKIVSRGSDKDRVEVLNFIQDIQNEHIIKIYGYEYGYGDTLYIYMEYLDGYSTLSSYTKLNKLNEHQIAKITCDLVYSLAFFHKNYNQCHGLLNEDNILVDGSGGNLKIMCGPSFQVNYIKYNCMSDIEVLGRTIVEMAGGNFEYGFNVINIHIPDQFSNDCKNFIQFCLILNPIDRPTAIELLQHEFICREVSNKKKEFRDSIKYIQRKFCFSKLLDIPFEVENINQDTCKLIPPTTTSLSISSFNQPFKTIQHVPSTVLKLSLPVFNQPIIDNSIPKHITSLSIPSFNQNIGYSALPSTLTELILGKSFQFNDHGGNIPGSIRKLSCSYIFKEPLTKNNNIPKEVAELVLDNYNQPIQRGIIPSTVHTLTLGSNYQHFQSLAELPPSVFNLTLGVSNRCPSTYDDIRQFVPKSVSRLTIKKKEAKVKSINLGASDDNKLTNDQIRQSISSSVSSTTINKEEVTDIESILNQFNQPLNLLPQLPTNIKSLSLPKFNQPISKNSIPEYVTSLSIPSFNNEIEDVIPNTLVELKLGQGFEFNDYGGGLIKSSIKILSCGYIFKAALSIKNNLPESVEVLILNNYNQQIKNDVIPSTVHSLTLGSSYQHFQSLSNLPQSVVNLTLGISSECSDVLKSLSSIPSSIGNLIIIVSNEYALNDDQIRQYIIQNRITTTKIIIQRN